MEKLDSLVCDCASSRNFDDVKRNLYFLDIKMDKLEKRKKELEDKVNCYDATLMLYTMHNLYLLLKNKEDSESIKMRDKIFTDFPMLEEYIEIVNMLYQLTVFKDYFLTSELDFEKLGEIYCDHQFIKSGNELKCAFCMASTENLGLSDEDVEVLTKFARKQGRFIEYATERDLPLINVLADEIVRYKSRRVPLEMLDEDDLSFSDMEEEYYLQDEAFMAKLKSAVKIAHMRDRNVIDEDGYQLKKLKYLSEERARELLIDVKTRYWEIMFSNSEHKDLLLEECLTSEFEIRILSGCNIPSLLKEVKNESELIALAKAYYNLMNYDFRENSGYFDNKWDALTYDFYTADQTVNKKILEIRLKR